jgi:hypothetical protein
MASRLWQPSKKAVQQGGRADIASARRDWKSFFHLLDRATACPIKLVAHRVRGNCRDRALYCGPGSAAVSSPSLSSMSTWLDTHTTRPDHRHSTMHGRLAIKWQISRLSVGGTAEIARVVPPSSRSSLLPCSRLIPGNLAHGDTGDSIMTVAESRVLESCWRRRGGECGAYLRGAYLMFILSVCKHANMQTCVSEVAGHVTSGAPPLAPTDPE